ncbi:MAG: AlpA family phage regulatory protein [Hyphomicrobiaceae bacterium]
MTMSNDQIANLRFLTMKEVCNLSGYSRTHIYRLEAAGQFPKRRKLSLSKIGFRLAEFEAWANSRPCAAPLSDDDDDDDDDDLGEDLP